MRVSCLSKVDNLELLSPRNTDTRANVSGEFPMILCGDGVSGRTAQLPVWVFQGPAISLGSQMEGVFMDNIDKALACNIPVSWCIRGENYVLVA